MTREADGSQIAIENADESTLLQWAESTGTLIKTNALQDERGPVPPKLGKDDGDIYQKASDIASEGFCSLLCS